MSVARRFAFPHPFVLLFAGIALAAALTWIVPAGQYERRDDAATGKRLVIAGTYHAVERNPIGVFAAATDISKGLIAAADVVFFVFLAGGAFTAVDRTGALRWGVDWLAAALQNRQGAVIPLVSLAFALGGALENLQEEIIAMTPVLLILCRRLGYDPLVAAAMSIGAASVGSAFSPVNPFQALLAQQLAQLPKLSGAGYRMAFMIPALALWIWGTQRFARRTAAPAPVEPALQAAPGGRSAVILALVALAFAIFVFGVVRFQWGFEKMAAIFFLMGVAAGLIGRLGADGTAEAFIDGFRSMAFAALLIGFARAIFAVLDEGRVVDTIVSGFFTPLAHLPVALCAAGMMAVQTALHPAVPSVGGQAALTLPVMIPLADLLGLQRQVAVLAYQYGAGLCELLIPTNGALIAILGAAGVRYESWLRFCLPLYGGLAAIGLIAILSGVACGLH